MLGNNIETREINNKKTIEFQLIIHPSHDASVPYWLHQISRPVSRALFDDGCQRIIQEKYGVKIDFKPIHSRSTKGCLGKQFESIEERALKGGRKVILLIDDEAQKMKDLMLPLTSTYHVVYAYDAQDGLSKLQALRPELAIVDMQISARGEWNAIETDNFKTTGINIIKRIKAEHPGYKIGVFTATRHDISEAISLKPAFILRKPCDPRKFIEEVKNAIEN